MTDFDVRTANLRAINSLTKYPSIPTYHALDPRNGGLTEDAVRFDGLVIGTEKVDGTNGRIIFLPDGTYLIGSREQILYAKGDLVGDPSLGIVDALKPVAEAVDSHVDVSGSIQVVYVEVYGGKVTAASKEYTRSGRVGLRLFDSAVIPQATSMLDWPSERIASWRDGGGQPFLDEDRLDMCATGLGVELAPRMFWRAAAELPTDVEGMAELLREVLPSTTVGLDNDGRSEGLVLRTVDRSVIAKARFQDYERTLKRRAKAGAR